LIIDRATDHPIAATKPKRATDATATPDQNSPESR
jgi:hypothetical protein